VDFYYHCIVHNLLFIAVQAISILKSAYNFFLSNWLFLKFYLIQKRFANAFFRDTIEKFLVSNNFNIGADQTKRLKHYIEIMPLLLGDVYCLIWGRALSKKERELLTYLSAFAPLMDDFFDKDKRDLSEIRSLIFQPSSFVPQNDSEHLAKFILEKLHALVHPLNADWKETAVKLLEAQQRSTQQANPDLSKAEVEQICYDKGGFTLMMGRVLLANPVASIEQEAIMNLGYLIQFVDDIFDIWEDSQNGIKSLANQSQSMEALENVYCSKLNKVYDSVYDLGFDSKNVSRFLNCMFILFVRGFVALEQFKAVEKSCGGKLNPLTIKRSLLICDMEKVSSMLKTYTYYIKYCPKKLA